jgi:2-isopropylmalate synthase
LNRTLDAREKLEIAGQLVELGVDIIEVGFPASSPGDFESVQTLSQHLKGVIVCGLTRAVKSDIERCAEALRKAETPRIQTGLGVSPSHMRDKLGLTPDQVVEQAVAAVKWAKSYVGDVQFFAEDSFRSDRRFLARVTEKVIEAGATVVNIPDTVGYATPWEIESMISFLKNNVKNIERASLSVHCHNDLGMATANSVAGVVAGADQVEGTINGIGERAGNAALEEVIMALHLKRQEYGLDLRIDTRRIMPTSQSVSRIVKVPVPRHKAVVGANAFHHASGIHQDGVLKAASTYEIISPELIGGGSSAIVLTARSGKHALKYRLEQLGYQLDNHQVESVYPRFLEMADTRKEVGDGDLCELMKLND